MRKTNIFSYADGVFFSAKLSAYKGTVPLNHLLVSFQLHICTCVLLTALCYQDIIKRLRFDLPANIEHNRADWKKVTAVAQEALTQIRGSVKKEVRADSYSPEFCSAVLIFE